MKVSSNVVIIDYGCGNLFSIQRALTEVGVASRITNAPEDIRSADKVILPGVGAFGDGMENLRAGGLADALKDFISSGKPLLAICLGMQILLTESFEFGHHTGLGFIPGKVTRLSDRLGLRDRVKVPHIGWSAIGFNRKDSIADSLLRGLDEGEYMYFIHSFFVTTDDPEHCAATSEYGIDRFCSIARRDNVFGVQFHPEISGQAGLKILNNFILNA